MNRHPPHPGYYPYKTRGSPRPITPRPNRGRGDARAPAPMARRDPSISSPPVVSKATPREKGKDIKKENTSICTPKRKMEATSKALSKAKAKRSQGEAASRDSPGMLCITEAYPPPPVIDVWSTLMKAHDLNPKDGLPLQRNNMYFVWMPNASWANDGRIQGYVLTVEGKRGYGKFGATPVIPDMFPATKMFYGTLCIRLPNIVRSSRKFSRRRKRMTKIHETSPIDALSSMTPREIEEQLNKVLSDETDFSSDGSFAGFYTSIDPNRNNETNVWIVVQTGDRDISRSTWYFLKGLYNPSALNDAKRRSRKGDDHPFIIAQQKLEETYQHMRTRFRENQDEGAAFDLVNGEKKEENIEEMKSKKRRPQRRKRTRKPAKEFYSDEEYEESDDSSYGSDEDDEEEYIEDETDLVPVEDRLQRCLLEDDEKKAWKYVRVLDQIYKQSISFLPEGASPESVGIERPKFLSSRNEPVSWENDIVNESSFLMEMERQVRLKRWLIANKLAGILGYDLALDFTIHPEKRDVDNHPNVVHVTSNTFYFNKKNAKTTYYCGCFRRRDVTGAIPVPISPLCGISILFGPGSGGLFSSTKIQCPVTDFGTEDVYVKNSYSTIDKDEDMGGIWSLKNEPHDSVDCFGAFPYGTGRKASYLNLRPSFRGGGGVHTRTTIGQVPVIQPEQWGPRGLWILSGRPENVTMNTPFSSFSSSMLVTWQDKRYKSHPRLAEDMFRCRGPSFQMREINLGRRPTLPTLHLIPQAIQMASPIDPGA